MYEPRFYREQGNSKLEKFHVCYKETDLLIYAPMKLPDYCFSLVRNLRVKLEEYISTNPLFLKSLSPLIIDKEAAEEIREMALSAAEVGVGPMASVAGFFAEKVGRAVLEKTDQVIVENGGDIFLKTDGECRIGVFAGKNSPFRDKLAIKLKPEQMPLGVCSSSGIMGPSLSQGKADVVTVLSKSTALADAAATAIANRVKEKEDVAEVVNDAKKIKGLLGLIVIKDDRIGVWGELELIKR